MLDFSKIKTYPIKTRLSKEKLANFFDINKNYPLLPDQNLSILAEKIVTAYKNQKKIIQYCIINRPQRENQRTL